MEFLFTLFAGIVFPAPPTLAGWLVWFSLAGLLVYVLFRGRRYQPAWTGREWGFFAAFLVLAVLAALFIGLRLSSASARPPPGLPANAPGSALMIFSAIPWLLGGSLLGPLAGAALGALAGILRGALDTYSLFSVIELSLLGAWFAVNTRQRFRTPLYGLLRQPLIAAAALIPFHILFSILGALFTQWTPGAVVPAAARLDFALSNAGVTALAFGGEMVIGGIVAQVLAAAFPWLSGPGQALEPSPAERSMETRFLFAAGTFISILLLTLLAGDWITAGRAAREMLQDRLSSSAESIAQSVPFFLETGQNLAQQLASDPRLLTAAGGELQSILSPRLRSEAYFDQIFILEARTRTLLAAYPESNDFKASPAEDSGLTLATSGVLTQIYSLPPALPDGSAGVSFMIAIVDDAGQVQRVLIGRTRLDTNPLTLPLIDGLDTMEAMGGSGLLLDENNQVLYHSGGQGPATLYTGKSGVQPIFYDDTAADGTRQLVYYQPVSGHSWAVVLKIPAGEAQQLALNIALPLSVMILVLAVVAMISLRLTLRVVSGSLQTLAVEAARIAQGDLDHPLPAGGVDEVGQLRGAFEKMRLSLQGRLEEGDRLLQVSQRVASSLEMQDAVMPVLEAIQSIGAASVRVVLSPSILPETFLGPPTQYASGPARDRYAHLDDQILTLARSQERIVLPNLGRSRELDLLPSLPQPLALLAVALKHENRYYGAVWAGFEQPRLFTESDIRFVTTLAGQAALAVSNAQLYLTAEASRRQLQAILNSTPDPVLVTDQQNRLILANQSAIKALGMEAGQDGPQHTEKVVKLRSLLALLEGSSSGDRSAEVVLEDKRTYLATASSVIVEGRQIARVCIMRDVTHFKELDTIKSEFVATVSHDLRSPLTVMRGYATMMETVGELNEQQQGYVRKMITGVENMSRLVNNLLDLGRIEIGVGLRVENVNALDIIERVTAALQLQALQKNIALSVEFPKDVPLALQADGGLLHQAVYNLVENAIKYTPEHGRVTVRVGAKADQLDFEIVDSGIGIPLEEQPRLFDKFYRGKQREARAQYGSGLGLAIVQSIAESHGGRVWVESVPGKGSTFHLQVPLQQAGGASPV